MDRADRRRHGSSRPLRRAYRKRSDAALRRQGRRHQRLLPRSRRFADGVHVVRMIPKSGSRFSDKIMRIEVEAIMAEAPGTHDPTFLPSDIPAPKDDGRARHLTGLKVPDIALPATGGGMVNLSKLKGRTVVYVYPRTGVPGVDAP